MDDIVLVTVDSLRADHVGWHGYDRDTTPNLDALAAESRVFSDAFAHACSTRPSFPSILTSAPALAAGGYERLSSDRTTLAEVVSAGGYRTAGFHSNLYLSADFGYDRGFDTFYDSRTDPSITASVRNAVKRRLESDGIVYGTLQRLFDATEKHAGIEVGSAYVDAADLTALALGWVAESAGDAPRFLWIHYMDVHHPFVPPAEFQRRFRGDRDHEFGDVVSDRDAVQLRRKMLERPAALSPAERETIVDLYDAEIASVDHEVDRLLAGIEEHWDATPLVAFTADHGEELGDHGSYSHAATFYDEVLHVPLLLNDGERDEWENGDDGALVGLLDLPPTLVDCAGLDVPEDFHGSSLVDASGPARTDVIAEWAATDPESDARRFAVRSTDWKYVRLEDGTERLFDLENDPDERENVVDDLPDVADEFRSRLRAHRKQLASDGDALESVAMDADVAERLRMLGYQE